MTKEEWGEIFVHELKAFPKIAAMVYLVMMPVVIIIVIIEQVFSSSVPAAAIIQTAWSRFEITGYLNAGLPAMLFIYIWRAITYAVGLTISEFMRIRKKNSS